jgi:four helix bundle protein
MMRNYKDLEIYKPAHSVAVEIHNMTMEKLPSFEMYEVASQIRRSSKSVPRNIMEGFERKQYQQEFVRYLTFALASIDETVEHLRPLWIQNL